MKKLVIYGCGYPSIVSLIEFLNRKKKEWEVTGFLDDSLYPQEKEFMGLPVLGDQNSIQGYAEAGCYFFNNVASTPYATETVAKKLWKHNAKICTLIFPEPPDLNLETISVGEGSLISPRVIVGAGAVFGKNVVVRQQAIVSHDSKIGDYCFIGPNACILGRVKVGNNTLIGAKALVREDLSIGSNCVIGMGAVVTKSVPDDTVVVGNPARPIPQRKARAAVKK